MEKLVDQNTQAKKPNYLVAIDALSSMAHIGLQETDLIMIKGKARIRPLTGFEEQQLKSANTSLNTFLKAFDKVLYEVIENKEELDIESFNDFLEKLTPQDKALMIYALALNSFSKLGDVPVLCEECNHEYPAEVKPEELLHSDSITKTWDKDIPFEDYSVTQTFMNGAIEIEIGIPTEAKRIRIMDLIQNKKGKAEDNFLMIDTILFFSKKITIKTSKKGKGTELIDIESELFPFIENLPAKIKDEILEDMDLTVFDDYMPRFYQESRCPQCTHINKSDVNIENDFFRKSLQVFG